MNDAMVLRRSGMRLGAMVLAALMAVCVSLCMVLPAQAFATSYTLGSAKTITLKSGEDQNYTFSVPSTGADVNISLSMLTGENEADLYNQYNLTVYAYLNNSSGSNVWYGTVSKPGAKASASKLFLPQGTYTLRLSSDNVFVVNQWVYHNEKLSFKVSKVTQKLTRTKSKGKFTVGSTPNMPAGTSKSVTCFKYSGSYSYASKNVKISKNTKPKVASAQLSLNSGGAGTLVITPKKLGKTVVSIKLAGGNTIKYTVYVNKKTIYVAKGTSTKVGAPVAVGKVKYKSSKSSVARVTAASTGKFTAKKQGKAKVYAKKSGVTYTYVVVVTDYNKLAKIARKEILDGVPDPSKVRFIKAYQGMCNKSAVGGSFPCIWVDYTYSNESGGSSRDKVLYAYTDTFNVVAYHGVPDSNVTSKKKAIRI
ncbi:MAG: hypothetical protein Q4C36_00375 [Coriobacteriia bacterium]|nr:hypothetical protein [Coriobacteriia bacterium]